MIGRKIRRYSRNHKNTDNNIRKKDRQWFKNTKQQSKD